MVVNVGSLIGIANNYGFHAYDCYSRVTISGSHTIAGLVGYEQIEYSGDGRFSLESCYYAGSLANASSGCTLWNDSRGYYTPTNKNCFFYDNSTYIPSKISRQGTGLSNFGSMTSLPSGFSSSTWQIVDGWPELKVFIK